MININPNKELFKWGPIEGRPIYHGFWWTGIVFFAKEFFPWPENISFLSKEKILFVCEYKKLREQGKKNFLKYIMDDKQLKHFYRLWQKNLKKFLKLQAGISADKLKKLSKKELSKLFLEWYKLHIEFWRIGLLPEISNWGGEFLLKTELEKNNKYLPYVFERLSAPEELSFYKKAELELLKIRKCKQGSEGFENKLQQYQRKYFWLGNSYSDTKILTKNHFKKELLSFSPKKVKTIIWEIENYPRSIKKEKKKIIKEYKLSKKIEKIAKRLSFCIWWQDLRKQYIFLANHYTDVFLREISKRYAISFEYLHYYGDFEIEELLKIGKRITDKEIRKRLDGFLDHYQSSKNKTSYYSGEKAKKLVEPYIKISVDKDIKELKGLVVSSGKTVRAKVKILASPKEVGKMKKGEILVASMTSPDFIVAMKKASAIITDEGGMTCHAAIVSRELGIPCITATRIATKVLKDGDVVEIDTERGVVRIIR